MGCGASTSAPPKESQAYGAAPTKPMAEASAKPSKMPAASASAKKWNMAEVFANFDTGPCST